MKQPVHFCKSWFRAKKKPTKLWPAERAAAAHRGRQQYTALIGSAERPYCFVDLADKAVGVGFLDDLLRESLTYAFKEVAPGRLFLAMATHREFVADTDKVAGGVTYLFDRDGTVRISRERFDPHRMETATSSVDPASNYAAVPEFGEYDDILRVER